MHEEVVLYEPPLTDPVTQVAEHALQLPATVSEGGALIVTGK